MPSYSEYKATFWETASSEVIAHSCLSLTALHASPLSENPAFALKTHQNFKPYKSMGSPCCASCTTEQPQNSYATATSVRTFSLLCASKWHIKEGRWESIKKYTLSTDMIVSRKTKTHDTYNFFLHTKPFCQNQNWSPKDMPSYWNIPQVEFRFWRIKGFTHVKVLD